MLEMVAAGMCLCLGFHIGKKAINTVEYHTYVNAERLKPKAKRAYQKCLWSLGGAYKWHRDNWKKGYR